MYRRPDAMHVVVVLEGLEEFTGVGALLLGCAHGDPNVGRRGIWLDCDLPGANVYVDDVYLQHAVRWQSQPMPLHPGFHRVEITAELLDQLPPQYWGDVKIGEERAEDELSRLVEGIQDQIETIRTTFNDKIERFEEKSKAARAWA